jgi:hypothetical protein
MFAFASDSDALRARTMQLGFLKNTYVPRYCDSFVPPNETTRLLSRILFYHLHWASLAPRVARKLGLDPEPRAHQVPLPVHRLIRIFLLFMTCQALIARNALVLIPDP